MEIHSNNTDNTSNYMNNHTTATKVEIQNNNTNEDVQMNSTTNNNYDIHNNAPIKTETTTNHMDNNINTNNNNNQTTTDANNEKKRDRIEAGIKTEETPSKRIKPTTENGKKSTISSPQTPNSSIQLQILLQMGKKLTNKIDHLQTSYTTPATPTSSSTPSQSNTSSTTIISPPPPILSTPQTTKSKKGRKKKSASTPTTTHSTDTPSSTAKRSKRSTTVRNYAQEFDDTFDSNDSTPGRNKRQRKPTTKLIEQLPETLKQCFKLIEKLLKHKQAWPFIEPVNPEKLGIPDYFLIIKNPMDLGTIKQKLVEGKYSTEDELAADVRLVWRNCKTYNPPEHDVVKMADELSTIFEKGFKTIQANFSNIPKLESQSEATTPKHTQKTPKSTSKGSQKAQRASSLVSTASSQQSDSVTPPKKSNRGRKKKVDDRLMTYDEKKQLSESIGTLSSDQLAHVVNIIQQKAPKGSTHQNDSMELEIDLNQLDAITLRELERYVKAELKKAKGGAKRGRKKKTPTTEQEVAVKQTNLPPPPPTTTTTTNTTSVATVTSSTNITQTPNNTKKTSSKKNKKSGEETESSSDEMDSDDDTDSSGSDTDSESDSDAEENSKTHDPLAPKSLSAVV